MIHQFPEEFIFEGSVSFTDPFRYVPHPSVCKAADLVIRNLDSLISEKRLPDEVCKGFKEGKMLGVLVVRSGGGTGYITAFSGSVGGQSKIEGFVPPIYDLLDPSGHFKLQEVEISRLNIRISELESGKELLGIKAELKKAETECARELERMKIEMAQSKLNRVGLRAQGCTEDMDKTLIRQSQYEKAELKRLKVKWEKHIKALQERLDIFNSEISESKKLRAAMSDRLQEWIFHQYIVHNASGESSSILDIFKRDGITPPGGTGDCAAPKLLEYAYRHGLEPLAMGEFWYGTSPDTAVRTQGHFYPSCTSKCGPLLGYMLKGLNIESDSPQCSENPVIIFEDDALTIVSKPSGMPSVPGLDGKLSVQEWLGNVHAVHRLDMDTSGILVFAKTHEAAISLRRQFEEHTVRKTYRALLAKSSDTSLTTGSEGRIELPLSPDYDERPRQKVDFRQGKQAITEYKVVRTHTDGTIEVLFHPITGRTHQLRVHAAHYHGLGHPIKGDRLYGEALSAKYLCLHAYRISFIHPSNGQKIELEDNLKNLYNLI